MPACSWSRRRETRAERRPTPRAPIRMSRRRARARRPTGATFLEQRALARPVRAGVGRRSLPRPRICPSGYAQVKGTSFASPAVAGAAAMVQAAKPGMKPQQLFDTRPPRGQRPRARRAGIRTPASASSTSRDASRPRRPRSSATRSTTTSCSPSSSPSSRSSSARPKTIKDSESAAKDNTDVFRIKLKKGELISANITTKVTDALFSVSLYDRTAGRST